VRVYVVLHLWLLTLSLECAIRWRDFIFDLDCHWWKPYFEIARLKFTWDGDRRFCLILGAMGWAIVRFWPNPGRRISA